MRADVPRPARLAVDGLEWTGDDVRIARPVHEVAPVQGDGEFLLVKAAPVAVDLAGGRGQAGTGVLGGLRGGSVPRTVSDPDTP